MNAVALIRNRIAKAKDLVYEVVKSNPITGLDRPLRVPGV
jgi:hypothetical protein